MTEMASAEELNQHIGRLVAFHRGRWYELLAAGPLVDGQVTVTVPASRFDLLAQPIPPGTTRTLQVFADDNYPVMDAPTDPTARAELLARGHHLVRADDDTDVDPRAPAAGRVEWHGRGRAVDLPLPQSVMRLLGDQRQPYADRPGYRDEWRPE